MSKTFIHIVFVLSVSSTLVACGGGQDEEPLEQTRVTSTAVDQPTNVDAEIVFSGLAQAGSEAE
ncbi:hypothetical protein [Variovorax sp. HJSM1_2]|uniref:hypothetical protein n=1 Tax=Variovorax sp. HJSM1_2 TaxID=3366263 RepID=UPI003BF5073B